MTDIVKVGGVIPFTTIDFPNHISCVLFLQGCPWDCIYCHNRHLIDMKAEGDVSWDEVKEFLKTRVNLLEGIVFSGGEPLAQKGLKQAIEEIKEMGFFVALHTNGYHPDALENVIPLISWIGLDVKAPFDNYSEKICANANGENVGKSLKIISQSGLPFEVRTTLDPRVVSKDDVLAIAKTLASYNVKDYALQQYRAGEDEKNIPTIPEITQFFDDKEFIDKIKNLIPNVITRES